MRFGEGFRRTVRSSFTQRSKRASRSERQKGESWRTKGRGGWVRGFAGQGELEVLARWKG